MTSILNPGFVSRRYGLSVVNKRFAKESAPIVEEEKGGYKLYPPLTPTRDDLSQVASEDPSVPVMLPIWPGKGIQFLKERRPKPFMYLTDEDLEEYKKEREEWEEWQKEWEGKEEDKQ